jgi:hypothetical protein
MEGGETSNSIIQTKSMSNNTVQQAAKEFAEDFCKPVYYHSEACHKAAFSGFIAGYELALQEGAKSAEVEDFQRQVEGYKDHSPAPPDSHK